MEVLVQILMYPKVHANRLPMCISVLSQAAATGQTERPT